MECKTKVVYILKDKTSKFGSRLRSENRPTGIGLGPIRVTLFGIGGKLWPPPPHHHHHFVCLQPKKLLDQTLQKDIIYQVGIFICSNVDPIKDMISG